MKKNVIPFIKDLKTNKKLSSLDESSIKHAVVMKLLSLVGWDIFDVEAVVPDYSVKRNSVDFSLKIDGTDAVFIVVVKPGDNMDNYLDKLLDFAYQEKVDISVLTNGTSFRFYLSSVEDPPEAKLFYACDIKKDETDEIAERLSAYLSKANIIKGTASEAAIDIYNSHKKAVAGEYIPEAWSKLLEDPDDRLVALLMETTGDLCGYEPDKELIEDFLTAQIEFLNNDSIILDPEDISPVESRPAKSEKVVSSAASGASSKKPKKTGLNYNNRLIESFVFKDTTHHVESWDDMIISMCTLIAGAHKDDFDRVLWSTGQGRVFFSKNGGDLRHPERIAHTSLFVEVNLSPNDAVKLVLNVLSMFEYPSSTFKVICKAED